MRNILVTGFEAFGTTPVNPTEQVAKHLDGEILGAARIVARIIPNTFFTCIKRFAFDVNQLCRRTQLHAQSLPRRQS